MARRQRTTIPGLAHHITQRGCRRQNVFLNDTDQELYLELLAKNAQKYGVEILAYCLMTNHVHLMLAPHRDDSLRWTVQLTHKRYADYINTRHGWSGHLWQERFYSCPVDDDFFWVTLRYIERNPVKAKMVLNPADYLWSSAAAHCDLREDRFLTTEKSWTKIIQSRTNWQAWLGQDDPTAVVDKLRLCTTRDLPCGSEGFLNDLETRLGVQAKPPKIGRPKKG